MESLAQKELLRVLADGPSVCSLPPLLCCWVIAGLLWRMAGRKPRRHGRRSRFGKRIHQIKSWVLGRRVNLRVLSIGPVICSLLRL